jgi:hydroxymethylpyrimidine/phosphomethylpyrimidine kinase
MASSSGHRLADHNIVDSLKQNLFPIIQLLTPNLNEASLISGIPVETVDDMKKAAVHMIELGCNAVLIKGGHLQGADLFDVYLDNKGTEYVFSSKAINSHNTHGTGCTLSSAIAAFLALSNDMLTAIDKAKTYIHQAIEHGKDVKTGEGHGPLNHFFDPQKLVKIIL